MNAVVHLLNGNEAMLRLTHYRSQSGDTSQCSIGQPGGVNAFGAFPVLLPLNKYHVIDLRFYKLDIADFIFGKFLYNPAKLLPLIQLVLLNVI